VESQSSQEGLNEWVFMRFYDFEADGLVNFNLITLSRKDGAGWQQKVDSTRLYPQRQGELKLALENAGFQNVISYGGLSDSPFDPKESGNLVMIARRTGETQ
jgi:hypothetical protein